MKIWTQLKKVHNAITYKVYTPLNKIKFLLNGVVYGKNLCVRGNIYIFKHYESGKIIIGDNVIINSASWANPIGWKRLYGSKHSIDNLDLVDSSCGNWIC